MSAQSSVKIEKPEAQLRSLEPAVDVLESKDSLLLLVDLPGVTKEGLDVRVEGSSLSLVAAKASAKYERSFRLPDTIDQAKIRVGLARGVARIELPKHERTKPQRIPVH